MNTQNEWKLFIKTIIPGDYKGEYIITHIHDVWKGWQLTRAPLLSRIAELEEENKRQGDALEITQKDAKRWQLARSTGIAKWPSRGDVVIIHKERADAAA